MTSANPSYKPSEGKREEFRKYLEKNGVMDALTRVLVNLYEEVDKPEDALEYIRDKLTIIAGLETHKQLQAKLTDAEDRIKELEEQLKSVGGEGATRVSGGSASQQAENIPADDQPVKAEDDTALPEEANTEEHPDVE